MACAQVIPQFELPGRGDAGRRRDWPDAEKVRIVEKGFRGHRQGSATARRQGFSRSLLTVWRRACREGRLVASAEGVVAVSIAPEPSAAPRPPGIGDARAEIWLAHGRRVMVPSTIGPDSLARLLPVPERA